MNVTSPARPVTVAATIVYPPSAVQIGMRGDALAAATAADKRHAADTAKDVAYQLIKQSFTAGPIDTMELQRVPGQPDFVIVRGKPGADATALMQAVAATAHLTNVRSI